MFVVSLRLKNWRIAVLCVAVLAVGLLVFAGAVSARSIGTLTAAGGKVTVGTNEERIAFLKSFGWEVSAEPMEIVEIIIPSEFGDVYENYNCIQKKQGYDLSKYKAKRVKRYTYEVKNYPTAGGEPSKNIRANILAFDNRIIGGDISSVELAGFMHGFKPEG